MNTLEFTITGMHCEACSKLCTMNLKELSGVTGVSIDPKTGKTSLESSVPVTLTQIKEALIPDGYGVQ